MSHGECFCGAVTFEVAGPVTDIYQCHCSLCRRARGSACISMCLASARDFSWISGEDQIRVFSKGNYRSTFCQNCGSPVPHCDPEETTYWIPAGLIDPQQLPDIKVGAHVYVASKAHWDKIGDTGIQYPKDFPSQP